MITLGLRSDSPQAELYLYDDGTRLELFTWEAHRQLADTVLIKIQELLARHDLQLQDLGALFVYRGPGSFTGLRIGLSVMNALSSSLLIPISSATGEQWLEESLANNQSNFQPVMPLYGSTPHITPQKK